ncbi:SUMF1/EgtB/PvdO family nonheme iron enzyme [Desulfomarina sp.]
MRNFQNTLFTVCCIFFLSLLLATSIPAKTRNMRRLVVKDSNGKNVSSFEGSYALVIGVSNYTNGWPGLPGVKKDIRLVREALEKKGFQVTVLKNPDGASLEDGFEKFIEQYGSKEDNRLLIYFAGHGHTVTPKYQGEPLGYIVPADAPDPHDDLRRFRRVAMSMQRIEEYSLNIDARHVLFLFDSCFSGSLFAMSRAIPQHISYKTGKPVRQYITSGNADETVSDESLFRAQFIEALNGEGDVNGDGYVTGSELGEFLQQSVVNYSKGSQHPQYGKIRHRFLDKGDFVFLAGGFMLVEQPAHAATGTLKVATRPTGAEIAIDGVFEGVAPLQVEDLKPGVLTVSGEKAGYSSVSKKLRIRKGRTSSLTLILDKISVRGSLTINPTPSDATVRILNISPRYQPGMELDAGNYTVELSRTGYISQTHMVELAAGEDAVLSFHLKKVGSSQGNNYTDPTTGMKFVYVKGGCFDMGDTFGDGDNDEKPVHEICVDGFYMGKFEVTQGQWRKIMGNNPSFFKKGDFYPVEDVSWNDTQKYIKRLNSRSGKKYRLPTEAEWEYAARSGGKKEKYSGVNHVDAVAWYTYNSGNSTHFVGRKKQNGLGLYDMSGNVWEWCSDRYGENYYTSSSRNNPRGAASGSNRVFRGGSWASDQRTVRSACRFNYTPGNSNNALGFRLVFPQGNK